MLHIHVNLILLQNLKVIIMSNPVPFKDFCFKYGLTSNTQDAKQQYEDYCKNLDMFNDVVEKNGWGGSREGAGRKTKYEETKVMRIPSKYEEAIKALITHLDETAVIDHNYSPVKSEGVYLRSLQDKKQKVFFTTEPISR